MIRSLWKGPFTDFYIINKIKNLKTVKHPIKIWSRRSTVFPEYVGHIFEVYNGHRFLKVLVSEDMIGHKFGEFVMTRKKAHHKS
jgi:small subunit ribosomal protein S19